MTNTVRQPKRPKESLLAISLIRRASRSTVGGSEGWEKTCGRNAVDRNIRLLSSSSTSRTLRGLISLGNADEFARSRAGVSRYTEERGPPHSAVFDRWSTSMGARGTLLSPGVESETSFVAMIPLCRYVIETVAWMLGRGGPFR